MTESQFRPPLSTPSVSRMTGFPGWHVFSSIPIHCFMLLVLLLWRATPTLQPATHNERTLPQQFADITPLPPLVKAGEEGQSGRAHNAPQRGASSPNGQNAPAQTYYGVQHIVSTPTNPDNTLQTVLQPDIPSPPKLPRPIPVPNMVKLAMPRSLMLPNLPQAKVTRAQPTIPSPKQTTPVDLQQADSTAVLSKSPIAPMPLTAREAPRLAVNTSSSPALETVVAKLQEPSAPTPSAREVQPTQATVPKSATQAKATSPAGKDDRNLLVVNALNPADSNPNAVPPPGELHGAFEVVPSLLPQGSQPGAASSSPQVGGKTGSHATAEAAGTGSGKGQAPSGAGTSQASGTDNASSGSGGHSTGAEGHGTAAAAVGPGSGSGEKGSASGSGGSSGSQSGPFPNVTIEAKKEPPSLPPKSGPADPARIVPHREGYGMTIISSGGSGGGLRDFGVFRDGGPTYTIYLDVSSIGIRGSRWSLQYGVAQDIRQAHQNRPLAPPYAVKEVLPQFPSQLVSPNIGRVIVVQADLTAEGKLEGLHVLQSPDPKLSVLLQECLTRWLFQSATIGGESVPIKILLGIPLAAVMEAPSVATAP